MDAVVGTLLIALVVLGFTAMVLATRKPSPPAWSSHILIHEFVAIGGVSMGGVGIALLVQSVVLLKQQPLTTMHVILIAIILVVFAAVWKGLRVRATLAEYARQKQSATQNSEPVSRPGFVLNTAGTLPGSEAAAPEDPNSPTRPRTPNLPKKAA
jgi:small-conductance mechanosensitive channel